MPLESTPKPARIVDLIPQGDSDYTGARFGIEIELEAVRLRHPVVAADLNLSWWSTTEDGSLRNGIELVSVPLAPGSVRPAIENAYAWAAYAGRGPSVRTGMHIHANAAGWDATRLRDAFAAYILAEPFLFAAAGDQREQNIYCVPWYLDPTQYSMAAALVYDLGKGSVTKEGIRELRFACKYSALNVMPLFRQHTIEFRHACTFDTSDEAKTWFSLIEALTEKAQWIASRPNAYTAVKDIVSHYLTSQQLRWGESRVEEHDLLSRHESFLERCESLTPCTYKASWGLPAALEAANKGAAYTRGPSPKPSRRMSLATQISRSPVRDGPVPGTPAPAPMLDRTRALIEVERRRLAERQALRAATPPPPPEWGQAVDAEFMMTAAAAMRVSYDTSIAEMDEHDPPQVVTTPRRR